MNKKQAGFGLLELMVVLVIASLLVTIALPAYTTFAERARVAAATADIGKISLAIEQFRLMNQDRIPDDLTELPMDIPLDPWQRSYRFLNLQTKGPGLGGVRKDGKLNPLNTDFDLYSLGRDGASADPLSAKDSRDDVIRANNGAFIGLGEDY